MTRASFFRRSPLLLLAAALVALAAFLVADGPSAQAQSTKPRVGFFNHTDVVIEIDRVQPPPDFDGVRSSEEIDIRIESPLTYDSTVKVVIDEANSTATQGADYRLGLPNAPGETTVKLLKLPRGESTVSFRVHTSPDYLTEGEEIITLRLEAIADAPYEIGEVAGAPYYYDEIEISLLDESYEAPAEADPQRGLETIGSLHTIGTGPGSIYLTATLTGQNISGTVGCQDGVSGVPEVACGSSGALTDDTFTYGGANYSIDGITVSSTESLLFELHETIPGDLVDNVALLVDGRKFPLSAGTHIVNAVIFYNTGLSWSVQDKVSLQLVSADSVFAYQLFLTSRPTADVTVTPRAYNRDRGSAQSLTISPASRTVSPDNWSDNLVFTVIAPSEPGRHVIFNYPTSGADFVGGDNNYDDWFFAPGVPQGYVYVTVEDDSPSGSADPDDFITGPGLEVSATELAVTAGGSATYTVKLGAPPTDIVVVTPTVADATKASVSPSQLVFTQVDWNEAQTVTVSGAAAGETSIFHSISTQDPAWFYAIQPTVKVTVSATGQQGTNPHAGLIAQMVEWRNDPQWVSYKSHTDRWDRALLAFGETVSDSSLTAMTASEAQAFADQGWTRWVEVAKTLQQIEDAAQQPAQNQDPPPQQPANRAPTVASAIADAVIVDASGTHSVSLSGVFTDADGDALSVTAVSSNDAVATVSVSADGSSLTVRAGSRGTATITVTAGDGNGGTVTDRFTVRVKTAPEVASSPADVELEIGSTRTVSLSGVFSDADGEALTIMARSDNAAAAAVSVAAGGSALTLEGASAGEATITVTARDADGNEAYAFFDVRVVLPPAPDPASEAASTLTGVAGRYDANGDGTIDHAEYLQATRDYDEGVIGILEVLKVRRAYLAGQG